MYFLFWKTDSIFVYIKRQWWQLCGWTGTWWQHDMSWCMSWHYWCLGNCIPWMLTSIRAQYIGAHGYAVPFIAACSIPGTWPHTNCWSPTPSACTQLFNTASIIFIMMIIIILKYVQCKHYYVDQVLAGPAVGLLCYVHTCDGSQLYRHHTHTAIRFHF